MRFRFPVSLALLLLWWVGPVRSQDTLDTREAPLRGVVWEAPADPVRARADLQRMRVAGVQAVRTGLLANPAPVLAAADALGLQVFQELPVAYVPAEALRDSLASAMRLLDAALAQARAHPSARYFGLARLADTSSPAACAYFEALTGRVREALGDAGRTFYTTAYLRDDRCAASVDLVLLDARNVPVPEGLVARWKTAVQHGRPVGLASVGTWIDPEAPPGLRSPQSAQAQARYLETALATVLDAGFRPAPVVVFAYRWRDEARLPEARMEDPFRRGYGLLGPDGAARPALAVLEGFYTGRQRAFAFEAGTARARQLPWSVLMGWAVLILMGAYYALSPRLRAMVPRYFTAHGFYRDAVREGRDMLLGSSVVLMIALAAAGGMVLTVLVEAVRDLPAFDVLFRVLPPALQEVLVPLLAEPWMLMLLAGSFYALSLTLWSTVLTVLSRRRYALMPGQAVMLTVWPRWPLLLLMVGAMVAPSLPDDRRLVVALGLAAAWVAVSIVATLRTAYDYTEVTRVPGWMLLVALMLNPGLLLLLLLAAAALTAVPDLAYVAHLAQGV